MITLTTGGVMTYLAAGITLWVHHDQLVDYVKNEPTYVMDGFTFRPMPEREFRLMNYILTSDPVEFES